MINLVSCFNYLNKTTMISIHSYKITQIAQGDFLRSRNLRESDEDDPIVDHLYNYISKLLVFWYIPYLVKLSPSKSGPIGPFSQAKIQNTNKISSVHHKKAPLDLGYFAPKPTEQSLHKMISFFYCPFARYFSFSVCSLHNQ